MKLQEIFSELEYNQCMKKIECREFFEIEKKVKPYSFHFDFRYCDNGIWKDNLMFSYGASYKEGGFSSPFNIDKMVSYDELCDKINSYWKGERIWYGDEKKDEYADLPLFERLKGV